jgi:hypothetical protein
MFIQILYFSMLFEGITDGLIFVKFLEVDHNNLSIGDCLTQAKFEINIMVSLEG